MKIIIKETGAIESLVIRNENNIDWASELINEPLSFNGEANAYEMTQDEFDWWDEYFDNYIADEREIEDLADETGFQKSEINNYIMKELSWNNDRGDDHLFTQNAIKEFKEDKKLNLIDMTWGSIDKEDKKDLLKCANAVSGIDGEKVSDGECIVDFKGYNFSVPGRVVNNDEESLLEIDDNAVIYKSL